MDWITECNNTTESGTKQTEYIYGSLLLGHNDSLDKQWLTPYSVHNISLKQTYKQSILKM